MKRGYFGYGSSLLFALTPMITDLFTQSGARFSDCGRYRYRLWRTWDPNTPPLVFLMLNPSIADVEINDPTVERCQRRAVAMSFGGLQVINVFALISTDPQALYTDPDPVGPENDQAILDALQGAGMLICAWGVHSALDNRAAAVKALIRQAGIQPYCLALNKGGSPKHPLYVRADQQPVPFPI